MLKSAYLLCIFTGKEATENSRKFAVGNQLKKESCFSFSLMYQRLYLQLPFFLTALLSFEHDFYPQRYVMHVKILGITIVCMNAFLCLQGCKNFVIFAGCNS